MSTDPLRTRAAARARDGAAARLRRVTIAAAAVALACAGGLASYAASSVTGRKTGIRSTTSRDSSPRTNVVPRVPAPGATVTVDAQSPQVTPPPPAVAPTAAPSYSYAPPVVVSGGS